MKLYYQTMDGQIPLWNFCASAAIGARYNGIEAIPFMGADGQKIFGKRKILGINDIDASPTNIIVGSVEMISLWLKNSGYGIPKSIDIDIVTNEYYQKHFYKRNIDVVKYEDLHKVNFPKFIKPHGDIKAFTGFVFKSGKLNELETYGYNYKGLFQVQDVVDIVSEYRIYICNNDILGVCHYAGEHLIFPNHGEILKFLLNNPIDTPDNPQKGSAYTIDVGVTKLGETVVIEFNDAWGTANYGLNETDYFQWVKTRWLELTKSKEYE
jgi:hypothetical protein